MDVQREADSLHLRGFLLARPRLMRLAYRFLGSVADAEDVVQEAWLRFKGLELIGAPDGLLVRIVTNLALDRLKSAQRRRENYVGAWLPEPLGGVTTEDEDAIDVSFAVMRALEQLSPLERASLFLHDLFGLSFAEVGAIIDRTPAACRKLAARGRARLKQAPPRFRPTIDQIDAFRRAFEIARSTGDIEPMRTLLAADVSLVVDGGGKVPAATRVLEGGQVVSTFLAGAIRRFPAGDRLRFDHAHLNGEPALLLHRNGVIEQSMAVDVDVDGRISAIYVVRNPGKLAAIA